MFDYKLVEALALVLQEGGFERAAKMLHLTQPAISQRVRLLEAHAGQLLLARTTPPQPTEAGQKLLKHYLQIKQLEDDLQGEIGIRTDSGFTTIAVGVNADSLATWFSEAVVAIVHTLHVLLDIRVDDQEQTHRLLKNGEVMGCISTQSQPMHGCTMTYLGCMRYRAFSSPAFAAQWFSNGFVDREACRRAPLLLFNRKDEVHHLFFRQTLGDIPVPLPIQYLPSSEKFVDYIAAGIGYGMLPDQQSADALRTGRLIDLAPGVVSPVELYWHCWNLRSLTLSRFTKQLVREARKQLS